MPLLSVAMDDVRLNSLNKMMLDEKHFVLQSANKLYGNIPWRLQSALCPLVLSHVVSSAWKPILQRHNNSIVDLFVVDFFGFNPCIKWLNTKLPFPG